MLGRDSSQIVKRIESATADIIFIAHGANRGIHGPQMAEPPPAAAYRHTNSPRISVCDGVIFDPMYTGTVLKTLIILLLFGTVAAAQDDRSIDIILRLLNHPDSTVRYFTASVTRDNPSRRLKDPMIQQEIKMILRN